MRRSLPIHIPFSMVQQKELTLFTVFGTN